MILQEGEKTSLLFCFCVFFASNYIMMANTIAKLIDNKHIGRESLD